jgi:hypothetical protein
LPKVGITLNAREQVAQQWSAFVALG